MELQVIDIKSEPQSVFLDFSVQSETNLKLTANIVARLVVVVDFPHSLLLGSDLMRQYRGTIDYVQQLVHLNGWVKQKHYIWKH